MRYQIRQNGHGLTLVEGDDPLDALVKFVKEMGGEVSEIQPTAEKNAVIWKGTVYYTEPPT